MGLIEVDRKIDPKIAGDWRVVKKYKLTEKYIMNLIIY
jgi:hypothetical protein